MSYFDDASLVMIPSGYKDQKVYSVKPIDGSGDLTFSRASDATRVNADGLVEKVRTNLLTYSNDFSNAAWGVIGTPTLTANYDTNPLTGANDAWRFVAAGVGDRLVQSISGSNSAFSLYVKGTGQIQIRDNTGTYSFNATLTSSWQRIVVSIPAAFTNVQWTGGAGGCDATIYAAQLETGDIATDYIPTTSAAVSVGPTANVPRLDYLNSSCPRLLLEPQRTNLALWSENFDNAVWYTVNCTETANFAVSPDGTTNAEKIDFNASSDSSIYQALSGSSAAYSISIFAKYVSGGKYLYIYSPLNSDSAKVWFDIEAGTVANQLSGFTGKIENYGNGWYRCTLTNTSNKSLDYMQFGISSTSSSRTLSASSVTYFYGAQAEAGAYATSYIPTLSSAVTRVADAASKTGISSLIGQTEGTLFVDLNRSFVTGNYDRYAVLDDAYASIYQTGVFVLPEPATTGRIYIVLRNNSADVLSYSLNNTTDQRLKIAVAYKSGDVAIYVNGVQKATSTTAFTLAHTLQQVKHAGNNEAINQTLVFKTRLSNADLATLTTL